MSAECPVCSRPQDQGLLCSSAASRPPNEFCTQQLERELGDVAAIVADLDVTLSRQARIGGGGPGGLARERMPVHLGAMAVADDLQNTLTTWARDVAGDAPVPDMHPARAAAWLLLGHIDAIRRHPAVVELHDEVTDAIQQARRVIDRPAETQFVGPCLAVYPDDNGRDITCTEDLYARLHASEVRCKVCGTEHEVAERRTWLLDKASDRICTVREAARVLGQVGGVHVTEQRIRRYIERGRVPARHLSAESVSLRLGDLLVVVLDDDERKRSA